VQALVPLQAPLKPAKYDPFAGSSVILTCVPAGNEAVQVGLQLIPAGLLVTTPLPLPARVTVSV
jgi:hypothetical protein